LPGMAVQFRIKLVPWRTGGAVASNATVGRPAKVVSQPVVPDK